MPVGGFWTTTDTFSPVVKPATIRLVLFLVVSQGWTLYETTTWFCGSCLSLLSLRVGQSTLRPQISSSASRLSDKLQSLGFIPSQADISLFYYQKGPATIFLLLYVDDILVASSSPTVVPALLRDLKDDFALKDLGPLHYFLGI
jgi:hypothetical protein